MKRKITSLVVMLFIALISKGQNNSRSMLPIFNDAYSVIELIEKKYNKEIVRMEFDIVQNSKQSYRVLYKDWKYRIAAFGDNSIADLDIKIYKSNGSEWVLIKKDQDENSAAFVDVEPYETVEYMIEISAYKFKPGFNIGHYALIIYHE
jgi:hypothetical protein